MWSKRVSQRCFITSVALSAAQIFIPQILLNICYCLTQTSFILNNVNNFDNNILEIALQPFFKNQTEGMEVFFTLSFMLSKGKMSPAGYGKG